MERRFEVRRHEILREAQVKPQVTKGMLDRLEKFIKPFVTSLGRSERKEHAQVYIAGLLSDLQRKNVESIAYRHDQERVNLQRFIGLAGWAHQPLLKELAFQVGRELGQDDGVIVFDPSGHEKCGRDSVGVQRQWLGRLGKIDNGQVGVYMGYASRKEHALADVRLYLPKEWATDKVRRKKCGVPKEIRHQTRHELALEMLRSNGRHLPHKWIAGDDEMGRSSRFRRDLRALGEWYLLAVPSNTGIRDLDSEPPAYAGRGKPPKQPFQAVEVWADSLDKKAWRKINIRDGEKGPLVLEIVKTRVLARTERSYGQAAEELLVVTRSLDENGKMKCDYYLSNAPAQTSLKELARVVKAEHRVEDALKRAKSEAGLSDYEVRTWAGWYHHQTLSLIATWFLIRETRRGKKIYSGPDRTAGSCSAGSAAAARVRSQISGLVDAICAAKKRSPRVGSLSSLQRA
ncbi:MAG: IS701 family transposase [Chloroflexi bacterium]|nr:IS701 family transposase [Chloroflexota bacterium]